MEQAELHDGALKLKLLKVSQAPLLFSLIEKNRKHLSRWFWWISHTTSESDTSHLIEEEENKLREGKAMYFGIWFGKRLVGSISLHNIKKHSKSASLGYWLDRDTQGKGVMTKACQMLIDFGFKRLNLHRIEIMHTVTNIKSKGIIKRLGFTHEGHFRKYSLLHGKFQDVEYYGLLRSEWKKRTL